MRLFADRLNEQLARQLHSIYMLFGNEPLLFQESRAAIRKQAEQSGFVEHHRFSVDSNLDWNDVFDVCQAMSLFSSQQIIELELPDTGVNATIAKSLTELYSFLHQDILLVIVGGKLAKAQEKAKWFQLYAKSAAVVNCLTPDLNRLPQFVHNRCKLLNLKPDNEALQMLAQWHEGNLLALSQSLEKLALLYPDGELNLVRLESALSRHNHFTAFSWSDALLAGKANRSQRVLRQLEAEGVEPIVLARTVQKELLLLHNLLQSPPANLGNLFDKHRIWQSKRALYTQAIHRLSAVHIRALLSLLSRIEILTKTQYEESPWPLLHQLSAEMCLPNVNLAKQ
ncbi:DNA polymerase III subunit delta [Vibrio sonorensis]|uniref:DNA polymerase III subunit delta n=1 Tax=Vibrio sonorensis TaxID=1004316 RepID=UPI0008D92573|nr:DNA polymerase III subunit delta [Vibrio sonorensis]